MKDNEIIKALECCITEQCKNCCNLGSWHEQWNCMTDLMKKALYLIKNQNENFESRQAQCKELKIALDRAMDEKSKIGVMYEELLKEKEGLEKRIEFYLGKIEAYKDCICNTGR